MVSDPSERQTAAAISAPLAGRYLDILVHMSTYQSLCCGAWLHLQLTRPPTTTAPATRPRRRWATGVLDGAGDAAPATESTAHAAAVARAAAAAPAPPSTAAEVAEAVAGIAGAPTAAEAVEAAQAAEAAEAAEAFGSGRDRSRSRSRS